MHSFLINMHKAFFIDRITPLTPKTRAASDRIPFTITFHPVNNSFKPLVNRNLIYLIRILLLLVFLVNARFFLSRKIAIFSLFLVKGILPSKKEPGTFRCSRKRCLTYPFVVSRTTVTGPKSTLNITDHFNCTTPNIYCIRCSNCRRMPYDIRMNDQI